MRVKWESRAGSFVPSPAIIRCFVLAGILITLPEIHPAFPFVNSPEGAFTYQRDERSKLTSKNLQHRLNSAEKNFYSITGFVPADYPPVIVSVQTADFQKKTHPLIRVDALEEGVPRILVDLCLSEDDDLCPVDERILTVALLLREYYGRKAPEVGRSIPEFPEWLSHGLAQLCFEAETSKRSLPVTYLNGGTPPSVDDFLRERAPDDESRILLQNYNARSACFLNAGLKGSGEASFREWIGHEGLTNGFASLPVPPRWNNRKLQRDWLLFMAAFSRDQNSTTRILSSADSIHQYDEIMHDILADPKATAKVLADKKHGGEFTTQEICSKLIALRLQASPLISPLVDSTLNLLHSVPKISPKKFNDRAGHVIFERQDTLRRSKDLEAYLDWYEATQLTVSSGLFDAYLKSTQAPSRKGPVGHYLDEVEGRGW